MQRRISHGDLALPLRIHHIFVGFRRLVSRNHTLVENEADNDAAIVGTEKIVDQFLIVAFGGRRNVAGKQTFSLLMNFIGSEVV